MTIAGAKDLRVLEPQAIAAEIEGYAWIPRMLDKARATLAGTNGSYLFGCPVDHTCMARLGVSPELILELAGSHPDDGDVLRALRQHGIPSARDAWFDGQAVEDELQGPGWYLRVRPSDPAATDEPEDTIDIPRREARPPSVSPKEEILGVRIGEITFFLGRYQARIVRSGETVWIPAGVEWWFRNAGEEMAEMTAPRRV